MQEKELEQEEALDELEQPLQQKVPRSAGVQRVSLAGGRSAPAISRGPAPFQRSCRRTTKRC